MIQSEIEHKPVFGIMNIGTNPTVDGTKRSIEVHFFDFNADIYHSKLKIAFLKRLRSEQKFENLEALRLQLKTDKINALNYIATLHA